MFPTKLPSIQLQVGILSRVCGDYYKTGYWIDNWIYWTTHSYTQLQCIRSYTSLHFTIKLAESHAVSSLVASLPNRRIRSPATLQLFSEDCCSARILTRNWNCPRHS
jgi:hypothetical protein